MAKELKAPWTFNYAYDASKDVEVNNMTLILKNPELFIGDLEGLKDTVDKKIIPTFNGYVENGKYVKYSTAANIWWGSPRIAFFAREKEDYDRLSEVKERERILNSIKEDYSNLRMRIEDVETEQTPFASYSPTILNLGSLKILNTALKKMALKV